MTFYVEFYNRQDGTLEHNDEYETLEAAFADAHGRIVVVARVEEN